jgi:enoyl-CoA hydratase/carnithine racemase
MKSYKTILTDKKGRIGFLTLNRPKDGNCETPQMHDDIIDALKAFEDDQDTRVVVITGAGDNFCMGYSYEEFNKPRSIVEWLNEFEMTERKRAAIRDCLTPTVVAVHGEAHASGMQLALQGDITIMEEDAKIGADAINNGLACLKSERRMQDIIGAKKSMEMVLLGEMWSAQDAERFGLINKIAPKGKLMEVAMKYANDIASKNPMATRFIKQTRRIARDMSLDSNRHFSSDQLLLLLLTEDAQEAMKAIVEGKDPIYTGR